MNTQPSPPTIDHVLSHPAFAALDPALCTQLRDAWHASSPDPARLALLQATLEPLATLSADAEAMAAAVLHALAQVPAGVAAAIERSHPALPLLLEGQRAASQVWALHAEHRGGGNAEGLRRLLLAIVRDLRVVPILLAEQLARMRSATQLPEAQRQALAQLTRDIHAPLANRLGIWQLKWELEDLAFRHLEPETYRRIAHLLDDKRVGRERYIAQVKGELEAALAAQGIRADVAGRPKHIYSIWKKMQKKDVPIGELYDLRAVRVLVDDIPACYAVLGAVHALWLPVPSEFDDYIARPKNNDYRSLHTAVIGPEGKTLEVQIRTHEMHAQAELGVAAHWRYKEHAYAQRGGSQRSAAANAANDRKIEWMRRLLDAHAEDRDGLRQAQGLPATGSGGERGAADAGESLVSHLQTELVEDRVYVLTPQGKVIDLPAGAMPLDFAYQVHTEIGHRCRGAKVDGRIVPLDYHLRSGERVEILTAKTGEPRRDWLVASNGFLASARSREKVRAWFHKLDRARNLQAGRDMLERELRRLGLLQADPAPVLARFNAASLEDLQVLVALGDVGPHQVGRALLEHERAAAAEPEAPAQPSRRPQRKAPDTAGFTVVGVGNLLVQVARCCQPLPGEQVGGYLTRARGVSVHRADCAAFLRLAAREPQRIVPVEWGRTRGSHETDVQIEALDRKWLLRELTNLIAQEDAHVLDIHSESLRGHRLRLRLRLRVQDFGQFSRLLGKIEALAGVETARRA